MEVTVKVEGFACRSFQVAAAVHTGRLVAITHLLFAEHCVWFRRGNEHGGLCSKREIGGA